MKVCFLVIFLYISFFSSSAQTDSSVNLLTRGVFLQEHNIEFKQFASLYTETFPYSGDLELRNSFLTTFTQLNFGTKSFYNYGLDIVNQSIVLNDEKFNSPFSTFKLKNNSIEKDSGKYAYVSSYKLSHIGLKGRIRLQKMKRFTYQQTIYFPINSNNYILNSDIFYEQIFNNRWMFFGDFGVWFPLKQKPFPYAKLFVGTMLYNGLAIYSLINLPYESGMGVKWFIHKKVELEFLYTYWYRIQKIVGKKKPQTFNFGVRITNFDNF